MDVPLRWTRRSRPAEISVALGDSIGSPMAGSDKRQVSNVASNWDARLRARTSRAISSERARGFPPRASDRRPCTAGSTWCSRTGRIDSRRGQVVAYANDMTRNLDAPRDAKPALAATTYVGGQSRIGRRRDEFRSTSRAYNVKTPVSTFGAFEYFVGQPGYDRSGFTPDLPTNQLRSELPYPSERLHRAAGRTVTQRVDFTALSLFGFPGGRRHGGFYPLIEVQVGQRSERGGRLP